MKTLPLLKSLDLRDDRPLAKPLFVGESGRVLRFTLKPNQRVAKHCAPHSPVHIVVLRGKGMFAGENGREVLLEPNALVVFNVGEIRRARARRGACLRGLFAQGRRAARTQAPRHPQRGHLSNVVHVTQEKPLAAWTIDELLNVLPEAAEVLERHGVNPLTRCHHAARGHMTLKHVLGRTCPVDDVEATFAELTALLERQ